MNFNKVQKRRAIGTVITTLIVLIASVVLGAGVIFFGGSLFQSNTEQESIQVSNVQSWAGNTTGTADSQLAFVVKNTGGKVVSINSISLRGTTVPVSSWYFNANQAVMTVQNTQTALNFDADGTLTQITLPSGATTFTAATGPVSLKQGETAIFYVDVVPINIGQTDVGIAYTMNVQAGKATAVQSVSVASGS